MAAACGRWIAQLRAVTLGIGAPGLVRVRDLCRRLQTFHEIGRARIYQTNVKKYMPIRECLAENTLHVFSQNLLLIYKACVRPPVIIVMSERPNYHSLFLCNDLLRVMGVYETGLQNHKMSKSACPQLHEVCKRSQDRLERENNRPVDDWLDRPFALAASVIHDLENLSEAKEEDWTQQLLGSAWHAVSKIRAIRATAHDTLQYTYMDPTSNLKFIIGADQWNIPAMFLLGSKMSISNLQGTVVEISLSPPPPASREKKEVEIICAALQAEMHSLIERLKNNKNSATLSAGFSLFNRISLAKLQYHLNDRHMPDFFNKWKDLEAAMKKGTEKEAWEDSPVCMRCSRRPRPLRSRGGD